MNQQSNRAKSIFLDAVELPDAGQRDAFVAAECGDDAKLRQDVERLLRNYGELGSFMQSEPERSPTLSMPLAEQPGTQIGPYKLLQQIGEGGMGVVYMAEQSEPVVRRVALKVIKPGMDTRQVISRFEAERQALAMMDHPNIARVLDAGTTDSGRPYFVMELVKGIPVTQYCDEQQLTPRERLELFVPVCQAIQHAHQKGIIHRDLKPTNILVAEYDDKAVPKVIDFGVAKAISQRLTERTMFTQYGQIVGTVEYMSPEQATFNALDVDTRSDVYSLGVLLYELLTGETPFDKKRLCSAALDELLRIIREEEPPRPSIRLSSSQTLPSIAANRKTEPAKLSGVVRGELDWIVMKALEKDRGRRYETANAFARDVQRYLSDEQVEACPPSAAYRLRKVLRRHRGAVLAVAAVLVTLVGGIVGTTLGLMRAEQSRAAEADRAEGERRAKLDAEAREAETQAILRVVEQNLLGDGVAEVRQPTIDHETFLALLEKTLSWKMDQLGADHPDTLRTMRALAASHRIRSQQLCVAGRYADSAASYRRALELDPRDEWQWYQAACVSLYVGDEDHFRQACTFLLDRASDTGNAQLMEWASRACTMAPNAVQDFVALQQAAERSVQGTEQHAWYRNFVLGKAATEYRAGDYESAVSWLRRFVPDADGTCWDATALAVKALAHDRLGHSQLARECLSAAQDIVAVNFTDKIGTNFWCDWLQSEIFCREAEQQLQVRSVDRTIPQAVAEARQRIRSRQFNSLSDVVAMHPGSREAVVSRAFSLLKNGRFEAADRDLERLQLMGDSHDGRAQIRSALLAYTDRDEEYEKHCRWMMQTLGANDDPAIIERTTKSLMLTPRCVVLDSAAILRRARKAFELRPNSWAFLLMGMAEYRHGQHEQAVPWLQKCIQSPDDGYPERSVIAHAYLAIVQKQLGQAEASRATLEYAERRAREVLPPVDGGQLGPEGIENWFHAHLALREARMIIAGSSKTPLPEAEGPAVPPLPPLLTVPAPFRGKPAVFPGVVQAEDFDEGGEGIAYHDTDSIDSGNEKRRPRYRLEAVDVDDCADVGGGRNIGGILGGEWLTYTVNIQEAGDYIVSVRFASPFGGLIRFETTNHDPICAIDLPATGWNNWDTATSRPVRLAAGEQVIRVVFAEPKTNHVCNLNWFAVNRPGIAVEPGEGSVAEAPAR